VYSRHGEIPRVTSPFFKDVGSKGLEELYGVISGEEAARHAQGNPRPGREKQWTDLVSFEILDCALVLLSYRARFEGSEVSSLPRSRILLAGIKTVAA
jgi:hypothetical protein